MGTTTEDLQRSAWRELYEMLSAEIEPDGEMAACESIITNAGTTDEFVS